MGSARSRNVRSKEDQNYKTDEDAGGQTSSAWCSKMAYTLFRRSSGNRRTLVFVNGKAAMDIPAGALTREEDQLLYLLTRQVRDLEPEQLVYIYSPKAEQLLASMRERFQSKKWSSLREYGYTQRHIKLTAERILLAACVQQIIA
jgi:hypothetical protein